MGVTVCRQILSTRTGSAAGRHYPLSSLLTGKYFVEKSIRSYVCHRLNVFSDMFEICWCYINKMLQKMLVVSIMRFIQLVINRKLEMCQISLIQYDVNYVCEEFCCVKSVLLFTSST